MPWDPECYHRFQAERAAPFEDLLALVTRRPGLQVVDLGCGTGELTRRLADALRAAWSPASTTRRRCWLARSSTASRGG